MQKYALMGTPLSHSISPFIHDLLFKIDNIDASYELIDVPKGSLRKFMPTLKEYNGFNVTIPYKTEIINYIDVLSRNSFLSNSVNNVKNEINQSFGYTTDAEAFSLICERENFKIDGDVVILGCGGVARAIALACIGNSSKSITLAIRESSKEKCDQLVYEFKQRLMYDINVCDINNIDSNIDILINATPVGMYPNVDECPVSDEVIKKANYIFDTIYNPIKTQLYKKAEEYNKKVIGGIEMLVYQAALSHTAWLNSYYTDEQLQDIIKLSIEEIQRIYG